MSCPALHSFIAASQYPTLDAPFGTTNLSTGMVSATFWLVILGTIVAFYLIFVSNFIGTVVQGMQLYTPHLSNLGKPL